MKKKAARKKRKPIIRICMVKGCGKVAKDAYKCSACRTRECRERDPVRAAFNSVKARATRSNIPFTLTLPWFRRFCHKTKYHLKKGKTTEGYNIDRIKEDKGYHWWNIQSLKKLKNIKKYWDWQTKKAKIADDLTYKKLEPQDDDYF